MRSILIKRTEMKLFLQLVAMENYYKMQKQRYNNFLNLSYIEIRYEKTEQASKIIQKNRSMIAPA